LGVTENSVKTEIPLKCFGDDHALCDNQCVHMKSHENTMEFTCDLYPRIFMAFNGMFYVRYVSDDPDGAK
jgi:hypothetical protein